MKTVINIKTEKEIKENAQSIAKELGITLSDVVNASLRNFIKTREVHFSAVPQMSEEIEQFIGLVEEDIKNEKNLSKPFSTITEMENYLDSL
jgi:addiction module RelB/DinJ family antitoxin